MGRTGRTRVGLGLIGVLGGGFAESPPAHATVYEVHVTTDDVDQGPNGTCTLREAVLAANADAPIDGCAAGSAGEDTIVLDAGTYTLTIPGAGEDAGASGDLDVSGDLVLAGRGAAMTTVSAAGLGDRVLQVAAGATVHVQDFTVTGGRLVGGPGESVAGGAIWNDGALTLIRVVVEGNQALGGGVRDGGGGSAGAIFNSATGTLLLDGARVSSNRARGGDGSAYCCTSEDPCHCFRIGSGGPATAGGILSEGELTVLRSIVTENEATAGNGAEFLETSWGVPGDASAGGIAVRGGNATLLDTIVGQNRAAGGHGEPGADGAPGGHARGAGVSADSGTTVIERTLVAENVSTGGNGFGTILIPANGGSAAGAGVFVAEGAVARLTSTTLAVNAAGGGSGYDGFLGPGRGGDATGGAVQANGTVAIEHGTLSGNVVVGGLAGITGAALGAAIDSNGSTTVVNTIVGVNYAISPPVAPVTSACDGASPLVSLGGNVESPLATCGFAAMQDQSGVSVAALALLPLAANGGASETQALGAGSVAIGAGLASACAERDQRNFARGGAPCDAGAFEVSATPCTDADHDGASAEGGACGPADCDDANPNARPGNVEIPGNGLDDDCSETTPGCLTPELAEAGTGRPAARGAWAPPLAAALVTFAALRALRRRAAIRR